MLARVAAILYFFLIYSSCGDAPCVSRNYALRQMCISLTVDDQCLYKERFSVAQSSLKT